MIPFLELKPTYLELQMEIDAAVKGVLSSGRYILGETVQGFESCWASYCSASHCVGVANGLDALSLSLRALGVSAGDEVLVPSNTYIATWLAISQLGAVPVPIEPDPESHNIDASNVESAITLKTKAIIVVHLYGRPAELTALLEVARAHQLYVVEDAAQAHGAEYKGTRLGAHGDLVCWSFYPGKNLGAFGDAGAVTTDNAELAEYIRTLANYGSKKKYVHQSLGVNSRLDPIQAAILQVKLKVLDKWLKHRRAIAKEYGRNIENSIIKTPQICSDLNSAWHLYVIETEKRDELQKYLLTQGVETLIHYPTPPHMQDAYRYLQIKPNELPVAKHLSERVLSLPIGPHLALENVVSVAGAINEFTPRT